MSSGTDVETPVPAIRELAVAARECPALVPARALAEWVGSGKPLTRSGVLKPAAAVEACDHLGIELSTRKPRSASDIDELMLVWSAASAAGLIEIDRDRVVTGQRLASWVAGDAENVLASWTQCVFECLRLTSEADEVDLAHLAVLAGLYERDGSASSRELSADIAELSGGDPSVCLCPACVSGGPEDEFDDLLLEAQYAEHVVKTLGEFDIAVIRDGSAELTPLGRWLADFMFRKSAPSAEVDAARLLQELDLLPPKIAVVMSRPWRSARTPVEAVRELLAAGESASGQQRLAAVTLAAECGPEAVPGWREWAAKDGFGAYARVWLAEEEGVEPADADTVWTTVDTLSIALDQLEREVPAQLLPGLFQAQVGDDLMEALPLLESCVHPAAPRVVDLLTAGPVISIVPAGTRPVRPPVSIPGPRYRIKIELRGVTEPSVWRRLEVPAELDLGQLHEVVQDAMGWENYHLHVFDDGRNEYGEPDPELGYRDERAVRLSQVLAGVGDKLGYTYDLGDGWQHDITLEALLPADSGVTGAVCVEGAGACPLEDCGGEGGYRRLKEILADPRAAEHDDMLGWVGLDSGDEFDPHLFSTEDVNQILSGYFSGFPLR